MSVSHVEQHLTYMLHRGKGVGRVVCGAVERDDPGSTPKSGGRFFFIDLQSTTVSSMEFPSPHPSPLTVNAFFQATTQNASLSETSWIGTWSMASASLCGSVCVCVSNCCFCVCWYVSLCCHFFTLVSYGTAYHCLDRVGQRLLYCIVLLFLIGQAQRARLLQLWYCAI